MYPGDHVTGVHGALNYRSQPSQGCPLAGGGHRIDRLAFATAPPSRQERTVTTTAPVASIASSSIELIRFRPGIDRFRAVEDIPAYLQLPTALARGPSGSQGMSARCAPLINIWPSSLVMKPCRTTAFTGLHI